MNFADINLDQLTMGELVTIEDVSGVSLDQMGEDGTPKSKLIMGIALVLMQRSNSKATLADVKKMTLTEITELVKGSEPDPKSGQ